MSKLRTGSIALFFGVTIFIVACTHPVEITGEGDIQASGDGVACMLEEAPCSAIAVDGYQTTYTAVPKFGFGFLDWDGCPQANAGDTCVFNVSGGVVFQYWGLTVPPLRANFTPEVPLGQLSGDFEVSEDCEGHALAGPEGALRYRQSTTVAGENQRQCVGNAIFTIIPGLRNLLVWIDILHIDEFNQPIFDMVDGEFPIREIFGNFDDPFLVGKTYTLDGVSLPAATPLSIEITWLDIDATFNQFTQCVVIEMRSPTTAPLRRKTYCPRPGSMYEIKENVLVTGP